MKTPPTDLVGRTISQFLILEKIGTGGMGEVYRARDTELKREVALKVLPPGFASDEERLARFQREAELLASLNHPNIAQIYGLAVSQDVRALVMELVEGETLAERVIRGPVPLNEGLAMACQIASGLASAHERGIIHRDLKPANIKLARGGAVKILDFGLAKAMESGPVPRAGAGAPTLTSPAMTYAGQILGTAAYMSPEQARGENADRRADIWAFGVVLFEMISGKPCFSGRTVSDYIAAVIRDEPDWSALPPRVPARISSLLRRCLKKDPLKRLRDIGDALLDIEEALAEPAPPPAMPAGRPSGFWKRWAPWGVTALFALVAGTMIQANRTRTTVPSNDAVRVTMALPVPLDLGERCAIALSRDGRRFAFVGREGGNSQIFVQDLAGFEARPLPGTEGGNTPFFSPDGEWLGFFTSNQLKKISLRGGEPLALCSTPPVTRGASWGDDGRIIFARTMNGELMRVGAAGGAPEPVTKLDPKAGELAHLWPEILPGAKTVIFTVRTGESFDTARIAAQSLETGSRQTLAENGTFARYVPTGHLLYMRRDTIIAAPLDAQRVRMGLNPVPVVEGVRFDPRYGCGQFVVAASGTLIYVKGDARGIKRRLVAADRTGGERSLLDVPGAFSEPKLSPDGRQLVVSIEGTHQDLWLVDLPRRNLSRLTFELTEEFSPRWTPDGRRLFFGLSEVGGEPEIYAMAADGGGSREPILAGGKVAVFPSSVAPDGRMLAYVEIVTDENADIWVLPLGGDRRPVPFVKTPFNEFGPEFSPDGRFLAYVSNESGRFEVYARPFPGPGPKRQVSVGGGTSPVWSRSGSEIFYRNGDAVMAVAVTFGPEFSSAAPRTLFRGEYEEPARPDWPRNYDVTPDGKQFLMIKPDPDGRPTQAQVVFHWLEELKRQTASASGKK
jgi:serine/threonine protein kinase/Tol biopolymer transport system component